MASARAGSGLPPWQSWHESPAEACTPFFSCATISADGSPATSTFAWQMVQDVPRGSAGLLVLERFAELRDHF